MSNEINPDAGRALVAQHPKVVSLSAAVQIPAIVDHDVAGGPLGIFESGAILIHLAEKTGAFLPKDVRARSQVLQWLMYQMSHVGPIIGQTGHFVNQAPEKVPYAIQRFVNESVRIIGVLNTGLAGKEFLAGEYSIADMATYPWVAAAWGPFKAIMPEKIAELGNVQRWMEALAARPAVQRGMAVPPA